MINTNKCPHCGNLIRSVKVEDITVNVGFAPQWKGFSYGCPQCNAVLGVQINPFVLNEDLANEIRGG